MNAPKKTIVETTRHCEWCGKSQIFKGWIYGQGSNNWVTYESRK